MSIEAKAPRMDSESGGWVAAAIMAGITAITSAIAWLAKKLEGQNAEHIKDLRGTLGELKSHIASQDEKHEAEVSELRVESKKCQKDREELRVKQAMLEARVCQIDKPSKQNSSD